MIAPTTVHVIPAGHRAAAPASFTDAHCYSAANGRAYRQTLADGFLAWRGPTGRWVARYDLRAERFVNLTRRHDVVCATWSDA